MAFNPRDISNSIPTPAEREAFKSATAFLNDLFQLIEEWRANVPEGKRLLVTAQTPDNRMMEVDWIRSRGHSAVAVGGYVGDLPCLLAAHYTAVQVFCTYEDERKNAHRAGFQVIIESQPESEPQETGKGTEPASP